MNKLLGLRVEDEVFERIKNLKEYICKLTGKSSSSQVVRLALMKGIENLEKEAKEKETCKD